MPVLSSAGQPSVSFATSNLSALNAECRYISAPSARELIWFEFVGGSVIDKLTVLEIFIGGFFGVACFWAPTVNSGASNTLFAWVAHFLLRLDSLRRERWQWLTVIGTMLGLRMQHQLPPIIELMVGLTFLILLVFPLRQIIRARR